MNATWKAVIGVILIFILGWFGGVLGTLIIMHHAHVQLVQMMARDPQATTRLLERMTTRGLKLDDNQKAQIHTLMLENVKERLQLQKQIQPQVWADNRQTLDAINALLDADQQQKFGDNLLLFKSRFGRNPLNTGPEDKASASPVTPSPATALSGTNIPPAGTAPPQ